MAGGRIDGVRRVSADEWTRRWIEGK